jgi:aspartokinase-like uncharacterized kinase
MHPPFVLKLGGSLEHSAHAIIDLLLENLPPVLIVPGGGRYANEVRKAKLPAEESHWMAIAAMDMFGWQLSSFGLEVTGNLEIPQGPVVFLPYLTMRRIDPLPHSWDVTSDTIAAWTAQMLGLSLVVAKPVDGIKERGKLLQILRYEVETDVVDACFIRYILLHGIDAFVVNGKRPERIRTLLTGGKPPGTVISATL